MLVSGAAVASAAEVAEPAPAAETSVSQEITISPRASDEIVWKFRVYNGVIQREDGTPRSKFGLILIGLM